MTKLIVVTQREDTAKSGIERCSATCYAPPAAYVRRLSATSPARRTASRVNHRFPSTATRLPPLAYRQSSVAVSRISD
ncbi:hypothetical protein THER5_2019 [Bifidobacterium thermacidophilum subsp. thermacidophilum]|uniref:Uncharacterized protein n=1 Tax=Bifidobacterium thermacidophilum subsp. thermacidophilum TaxID=79262 RepID=A0A087E6H0_9BIFI|nr:hypothetical protein THER5_2019 [Bifidobacterium thermacidophilum subsp. thermacidophilum]